MHTHILPCVCITHRTQMKDTITTVLADNLRERTIGLNYDSTVEAIGRSKHMAVGNKLTLELTRVVKRAEIMIEVDDGSGNVHHVRSLAGENLRRVLLRKGYGLYDDATVRFDMPQVRGSNCGGEGCCGTCIVDIRSGRELLNEQDQHERSMMRNFPAPSWRAACRTIVGADNQSGTLRLRTTPQSARRRPQRLE
mmetsp:Transcript_15690/g.43999  ORF Transcript_15690/g.43999 Transcript_15690/m.43999 type:complete len:195 (-) Transcript_15690:228-812(-)